VELRRWEGILHRHPPLTPAGVLLRHRVTVPGLLAAFGVLAVMASFDRGELLRAVDEPVSRALIDVRTPWLDSVVKAVSRLGGTTVVVVGLVVLLVPVWRRCHSLAYGLLAATIARPLVEWTLKELVDRARPEIDQLVSGPGPSFPSGHVMAAVALWGLLPPIVALVTHRRVLWWLSVALSAVVVTAVAFARVYLGVHWLSDVVGGLVFGSIYLLAVEWLLDRHHERRQCKAFMLHGRDVDAALAQAPPAASGRALPRPR